MMFNDYLVEGIVSYEDKYKEVVKFFNYDIFKCIFVFFDVISKDYLKVYFDIVFISLEKEGVDFWWIDWQ